MSLNIEVYFIKHVMYFISRLLDIVISYINMPFDMSLGLRMNDLVDCSRYIHKWHCLYLQLRQFQEAKKAAASTSSAAALPDATATGSSNDPTWGNPGEANEAKNVSKESQPSVSQVDASSAPPPLPTFSSAPWTMQPAEATPIDTLPQTAPPAAASKDNSGLSAYFGSGIDQSSNNDVFGLAANALTETMSPWSSGDDTTSIAHISPIAQSSSNVEQEPSLRTTSDPLTQLELANAELKTKEGALKAELAEKESQCKKMVWNGCPIVATVVVTVSLIN